VTKLVLALTFLIVSALFRAFILVVSWSQYAQYSAAECERMDSSITVNDDHLYQYMVNFNPMD